MKETEITIQLYITTKDIGDQTGINHVVVKDGLLGLFDIIPHIQFNGKEVIYVHLKEPVSLGEAYLSISQWCNELEKKGKVSHAECKSLPMPVNGDSFHLILDVNNNLIENRYLIVISK